MAHGIYYSSDIKHGDIVTFRTFVQRPTDRSLDDFNANYRFIWDVYNEVAKQNGIDLPFKWASAQLLNRRHRYTTYRNNCVILEPMGPTRIVNHGYSIIQSFHTGAHRGAVISDTNWYRTAENYFMVGAATPPASSMTPRYHQRQHFGVMCEKFRAIKLTPPK